MMADLFVGEFPSPNPLFHTVGWFVGARTSRPNESLPP